LAPSSTNSVFNILLVDDRPENLLSLEEILAREGRHFIKVTSGAEALKEVLKNDQIGLIMLDVQMPDMDGFEVARLLKSNVKTRDISVIFVTAINREEQYVLKGFEEGAVDYLQKPLDINVTKAKVNVFEQLYFYQKKLKSTVSELERINKQLEKFVYIVAHDLKSPLSGIIGMLSILELDDNILKSEETLEYVSLLSSAAHHLSDMITSILEYSKGNIDQQKKEQVDANELVNQIAFLLFPPKHITIKTIGTLPTFTTQKIKLQQAFQNLISNAIKYNDKPQGKIEIGYKEKGDFYEFYVNDNGPGISDRDQEKIFGLFQTTDNKTNRDSSTGVGLNIIKMMMEEQGGKIWVESHPGEGSTFFFEWRK
jgi:two-component system, sensor histidine kinase and response regulator